MNNVLRSVFTLLLFLTVQSVHGQIIPSEWEGVWRGSVDIWLQNEKVDSFPMSLEILAKDSTWSYTVTYDRDPEVPDVRNYELIVVDDATYHLAIDEKNSIVLDAYFNDNCLYAMFSGLGSDLQSRTCLAGDELEYEIASYLSDPVRVSGNEVIKGDTIPEISSFAMYHLMKARLRKDE
ncbi:MAG: hypothetical protein AAFN65_11130 [Bacteroidota bacterium]